MVPFYVDICFLYLFLFLLLLMDIHTDFLDGVTGQKHKEPLGHS